MPKILAELEYELAMLEQVFQMCEKLTKKKKNNILLTLILGTAYMIFM